MREMRNRYTRETSAAHRKLRDKYKNLWLRLTELFPDLQEETENGWNSLPIGQRKSPIQFEELNGETTEPLYSEEPRRVWGFMVWTIWGVKPEFWRKVVVPLLASFETSGTHWSSSIFDEETFAIHIPAEHQDVIDLRRWAATGYNSFDGVEEKT